MYGYYGYDTLFLAVIVVFILGIWAQIRVKNTYKKYCRSTPPQALPQPTWRNVCCGSTEAPFR